MKVRKADRLNDAQEYYFSSKLEIIQKMRASGADVINLGIGSPDLPPAPAAIEAAGTALRGQNNHGYASYRSTPELRRAMADWYGRAYGYTPDFRTEVLPLLGSKEGILYTTMAFVNPGDRVLVPNPGYPAYSSVARLLGAEVVSYDLTAEDRWAPDFDALERAVGGSDRFRLMWVNYPHMPTGASGSPGLFKRLVEFGQKYGILIAHDNPYGLVLPDAKPLSILSFDPAKETCLELNSLSKAFNMAGWRVGMCVGPAPILDAVLQVKSNVDSGMFLPVQAGARAALAVSDDWHAQRNETYARRRELVWRLFEQLGFSFERDQVGLFVWAKAPASISNIEAWVDEVLDRSHVFLTPGFIFGTNGDRYVRASLCVPEARIAEALERIGRSS
jgi:LL-diaminopimelate aminotransferase